MADLYARNPLLEDAVASTPGWVREALAASGPAPTLFAQGDLPKFTGSGISPESLLDLPWMVRHAAAAAELDGAQQLFEEYGGDPGMLDPTQLAFAVARDDRNGDYAHRFAAWLHSTVARNGPWIDGLSPAPGTPSGVAVVRESSPPDTVPGALGAATAATMRLHKMTAAVAAPYVYGQASSAALKKGTTVLSELKAWARDYGHGKATPVMLSEAETVAKQLLEAAPPGSIPVADADGESLGDAALDEAYAAMYPPERS